MPKWFQKNRNKNGSTSIRYYPLGANLFVTGSMHLIEVTRDGKRTLFVVDAGSFQGKEEFLNSEKRLPKGIQPKDIDFLLITHVHFDHTGHYVKMVRSRFDGEAYASEATAALMEITIPDSGRIQEQRAAEEGTKPEYTKRDAVKAMKLVTPVEFSKPFSAAKGITVEFLPSPHLLGAAVIKVTIDVGGGEHRILVFSGDIGRKGMPGLPPRMPKVGKADFVVCESLNGKKVHPKVDLPPSLAEAVKRGLERAKSMRHPEYGAGKIIIFAFAMGKSPVLLNDFQVAKQRKLIPANVKIMADSPSGLRGLEVHREFGGEKLFSPPGLEERMSRAESAELDEPTNQPFIIITSPGSADFGRAQAHLKSAIQWPRNTLIFVGHQIEGSTAALLTSGARSIEIDGETFKVKAHVELLPGYSGHGDQRDIIDWLSTVRGDPVIFLNHGEEVQIRALKSVIEKELGRKQVAIPQFRSCYELFPKFRLVG